MTSSKLTESQKEILSSSDEMECDEVWCIAVQPKGRTTMPNIITTLKTQYPGCEFDEVDQYEFQDLLESKTQLENRKKKEREYRAREEVKERRKQYAQREDVINRRREYQKKVEVVARRMARTEAKKQLLADLMADKSLKRSLEKNTAKLTEILKSKLISNERDKLQGEESREGQTSKTPTTTPEREQDAKT